MSRVVTLTADTWDGEVLRSPEPVIVDFWAEWCAPCRMMTPTIEALATELDGRAKVCKLNVDENEAIAKKYGILGIPTVMVFVVGDVREHVVGVTSPEYLLEIIEKHVS